MVHNNFYLEWFKKLLCPVYFAVQILKIMYYIDE